MRSPVVLGLLMLFGYSASAFAYLDPGTGSILLQGLLAAIVGALATVKLFWQRISDLLASWFKRDRTSKPD